MDEIKKTGPRDVFSHLLAVIFLYCGVFAFGSILFSFINMWFPDALDYYGASIGSQLRFPLAVLVVIFPLYVWLTWYLANDVTKNPEKRELKTRKWLLYFTLFATTIAIVIDLVSLIFTFLNGSLTVRFVLKAAVVLAIAAAIFVYYLWAIRKGTPARENQKMKAFIYAIVVFVSVSIIYGFFVAGSPMAERARQFDQTRINDLTTMQYQIVEYWRSKRALPATLADLRNEISGYVPPLDPETNSPYEYRIVSDLSFELCATFNAASDSTDAYTSPRSMTGQNETWQHDKGRTCFTRTIDPDLYPPITKPLQ